MKNLPVHKKRPELLAPAGSFQALRAVIFAGADAAYAGGSQFGARAYAKNFTHQELLDAIDFVHLYGKKLYLAVNTLLKQAEMESLYSYLLPYYRQGLDAVIVQDFGVMQLIRRYFPDLPVHISTQMSVASAYGFAYLQKWGAKRIVTARELSLEEIREIRSQSSLEIECFVHGALCYCYSGQCLFSSMLGARSGNRGRCAQPCRLPYTALDTGRRKMPDAGCYPLSPKDLCTLGQLPQLIEAGISSFKIEGRMKSAEYAAGVTAVYRNYMDQYMERGFTDIKKQDYGRLLQAGNRSGFTGGYYGQHNGRDMITMVRPGHEKSEAADLSFLHEKKIPVRAEAYFKIGEPAGLLVSDGRHLVTVQHGMVQAAKNQPMRKEMIIQQLSKTGNTPFAIESIAVQMEDAVFVPKQELNELRRKALGQFKEQMLQQNRRACPHTEPDFGRQGHKIGPVAGMAPKEDTAKTETGRMPTEHAAGMETGRMPTEHAAGMETGRTSKESVAGTEMKFTVIVEEEAQLFAVLGQDFIGRVYLDSSMYTRGHFATQLEKHINCVHAAKKQAYLILPPVFRGETARFYREQWQSICGALLDGCLVKTQDELGFLEQVQMDAKACVLDYSLYAYSDETKACYQDAGWGQDTVPLELNKKELRARNNTASELVIYGHIPLMTSAQCILKTFGRCKKTRTLCYLKDRYAKELPVKNVCSECYNTVYNPQPLSLIQLASELGQLQPAAYRLWFTIEDGEKTRRVLNSAKAAFLEHQAPDMAGVLGAYTNGHYKRGTE